MKYPLNDLKKTSNNSPADVLHFCGHMISIDHSGRFPKSQESSLKIAIENYFENNRYNCAFGSLAAGADILIAELALKYGVAIHLIFPYPIDDFVRNSVMPSGLHWVERFNAVLEKSETNTLVHQQLPANEVLSYAECTQVAMGLALLKAFQSATLDKAKQLVLWDKKSTNGVAGSYPDMLRWQSLGLNSSFFETKAKNNQTHLLPLHEFNQPIESEPPKSNQQTTQIESPLTIVAYHNDRAVIRFNLPLEHSTLIANLQSNDLYYWDLEHDIFGQLEQQPTTKMTDRCAGMLAFHLFKCNRFRQDENVVHEVFNSICSLQLPR